MCAARSAERSPAPRPRPRRRPPCLNVSPALSPGFRPISFTEAALGRARMPGDALFVSQDLNPHPSDLALSTIDHMQETTQLQTTNHTPRTESAVFNRSVLSGSPCVRLAMHLHARCQTAHSHWPNRIVRTRAATNPESAMFGTPCIKGKSTPQG